MESCTGTIQDEDFRFSFNPSSKMLGKYLKIVY
jgi:hypothetical protein